MLRLAMTPAIGLTIMLAQPASGALGAPVRADFDGDGYGDVAVGTPAEAVGSTTSAGVVNVLYGGPAGPGQNASVARVHAVERGRRAGGG